MRNFLYLSVYLSFHRLPMNEIFRSNRRICEAGVNLPSSARNCSLFEKKKISSSSVFSGVSTRPTRRTTTTTPTPRPPPPPPLPLLTFFKYSYFVRQILFIYVYYASARVRMLYGKQLTRAFRNLLGWELPHS